MFIARIRYDMRLLNRIIGLFRDIFVEFDRDFIDWRKRNFEIVWETDTIYYFKSRREMIDFLIGIVRSYENIGFFYIVAPYYDNILEFFVDENVAYVGDDQYMLYMSPIFYYDESRNYSFAYYVSKSLSPIMLKRNSEVYLSIYHNVRRHTIDVFFYANGINRKKYYRMAKQIKQFIGESTNKETSFYNRAEG